MKVIAELVDKIDDEIEDAKEYAEAYLQYKAESKGDWAGKYKQMSTDELNHAMNLHAIAVSKIEELKKVYTPPTGMQEAWDKSHARYVEQVAWIKQMLSM